jgi:hypothetical protein
MITSIVKGIWTTLKNPKLVLLLWAWNLLLGIAAVMPARAWFGTALDARVETESLLTRFNLGTFVDLSKYHEIAPFTFLIASMMGVGFVALVGNAFMNGGILEVLGNENDSRSFMHRLYRGGGHFFWRFVRLGIVALISGAVVAGIVAAFLGKITTPLSDSEWEPAGLFWGLGTLAVAGLVALWFVLALDYARIRVARDGSRGMLRVYFGAMGFVARHVVATYGIAILALAGAGALLLAYVAHETVRSASTWPAILALAGAQQIIILARTWLRVMQVGAERQYFITSAPVAAAVVSPAVSVLQASPTIDPPAGAEAVQATPTQVGSVADVEGPAEGTTQRRVDESR